MRTLSSTASIALLITVFAAACAPETVQRPPEPPVNWKEAPSKPKEVTGKATDLERAATEAYSKALVSQGFAQLGATLNEDAHFTFAGERDVHGRDDVVKAHAALFGAFDDRKLIIGRLWITESAQALEWTMTGIQAREWVGVAATRKPIVIRGLTLLWTHDDGSIVDVHVYFDEAVLKAQLGAGPKELQDLPTPAASSAARQDREQTPGAEQSANVDAVRAELEALEKGDEAAYLGAMSDDVEVSMPESAQPARGKNEARAYFRSIRKAIGELDTSVEDIWGIRQFVIVEYSIVGQQAAALGWIPYQKDRLLRTQLVDILEMQGGKIKRIERYEDPGQILSSP